MRHRCLLGLILAASACSSSSTPADSAPADRSSYERRGELGLDGLGEARADLIADSKPRPPARWDSTGSLAQARKRHTATVLEDGTVLVVGGVIYVKGLGKQEALRSAERFDPKAGSWSSAGTTSGGRYGHEAVRLQDGRVLVVGGCASGTACSDFSIVEIYDPKGTPSWTVASPLNQPRYACRAALLQDGRVLVAGGYGVGGVNLKSLEIFDPQSGLWASPAVLFKTSRNAPSLSVLGNGKVLIAGGYDGDADKPLASLAVFDPKTGSLTELAATLGEARFTHTATRLADGRVLLVGGDCTPQNPACKVVSAEIYDPATDTVSNLGSPGSDLYFHTATLLADGRVLVVGGQQAQDLVRILDPVAQSWLQTAALLEPRAQHAAALLGDGRVLVVGGVSDSTDTLAVASASIYTP